ncbi:uncharacterized protein A1O9_01274 [Exophiala aquamarina CBS 119918]|uniref:VOC domain-containing protein n=1 Tax=Exophiala aquamarina CBS 119918 TaxID=1182545 RepID=A0A072PUA7_9EURO|nr:uncharacterized protein A1O9_01274 [Exophiala aquamarina CBS 119918]KEF63297.1 hypothetical protein A1O9_01274 [Exophiala aquamarina CBS 119918]
MPITGIAHINLTVPSGTLPLATEFYSGTLGLTPRPVPHLQRDSLAWFDIADSGQQVHIAFGKPSDFTGPDSSRHPCFKLSDGEALLEMRRKVYEHFQRGGESAPKAADKPGDVDSGAKGVEYPQRFFARDYAGNRLEFSL